MPDEKQLVKLHKNFQRKDLEEPFMGYRMGETDVKRKVAGSCRKLTESEYIRIVNTAKKRENR